MLHINIKIIIIITIIIIVIRVIFPITGQIRTFSTWKAILNVNIGLDTQ